MKYTKEQFYEAAQMCEISIDQAKQIIKILESNVEMPKCDLSFVVTVEYICCNMVDTETFINDYDASPEDFYESISDNYSLDPMNFADECKIISVKIL